MELRKPALLVLIAMAVQRQTGASRVSRVASHDPADHVLASGEPPLIGASVRRLADAPDSACAPRAMDGVELADSEDVALGFGRTTR